MKRILIIEREYGAGAGVIAAKAAERLRWRLLDEALTEEIARSARVRPELCREREERVDPWLYRLAKVFWRGSFERSIRLEDVGALDADRLVALARQVIEEAARAGHCVIVGRGAPYFLRDRPDAFCVFLYAPRQHKLRRVLAQVKNEAEAADLIDSVDEERREFIRHYFHREWPWRPLYHVMLNTAAGDDATVDTILRLMEAANQREEAGGS